MRVGVVGGGVVGRATARAWLEHCDRVRIYDTLPERSTHPLHLVLECDLIFVCLPEAELDAFFTHPEFSDRELGKINRERCFAVKSTVPIGATRRLAFRHGLHNVVHNPEFLTSRCAFEDAQCPARSIVGIPSFNGAARNPYPGQLLVEALECRFPGVPIHVMSSDESEAVKLFCNAFFAVKVSVFNEFRDLADALKLDWDRVLQGMLSDGRIGHSHTMVPGPDGKRGFGGCCLPKDLMTLRNTMKDEVLITSVIDAALDHTRIEP